MDENIEQNNKKRYSVTTSSRGGARPNAGRPKGGTNKITGATILESIEKYSGEKFEDLLAQGYLDSIREDDKMLRLRYEQMFLGKVVADKVSVEVNDSQEAIDLKKQAFIDALASMTLRENIQLINNGSAGSE